MKTKHSIKTFFDDEGPTEIKPLTKADTFPGPNEYAAIPNNGVGEGQYDDAAKFAQVAHEKPNLRTVLKGHITANEMIDQADDMTFNGYCNDN